MGGKDAPESRDKDLQGEQGCGDSYSQSQVAGAAADLAGACLHAFSAVQFAGICLSVCLYV